MSSLKFHYWNKVISSNVVLRHNIYRSKLDNVSTRDFLCFILNVLLCICNCNLKGGGGGEAEAEAEAEAEEEAEAEAEAEEEEEEEEAAALSVCYSIHMHYTDTDGNIDRKLCTNKKIRSK